MSTSEPFNKTISVRNRSRTSRCGLTLVELLLAVSILAVVTVLTWMAFAGVTDAWKRGMVLGSRLERADFIMEELVDGLRSAYCISPDQGFVLGVDEGSKGDQISWVKKGVALTGSRYGYKDSPHRVVFSIEDTDSGPAAAVKFWLVEEEQREEFDRDEIPWIVLSRDVETFECEVQDPATRNADSQDEVKWVHEWKNTNSIPEVVKLKLVLQPLAENETPLEVQRIVRLPLGAAPTAGTPPPSATATNLIRIPRG